jgi:trans-aconitate methyltransferase
MLGETLDYWMLKGFAHRRNIATEDELNSRAGETTAQAFEAAMPKMRKLMRRFGGRLSADPTKRYLDMGCGTGELTLALARMGAGQITGVDFVPRSIDAARTHAARMGLANVNFECCDLRTRNPQHKYDVLLSFDAFEHIETPGQFLARMKELIAPGGVAVMSFGPLFHSPFGDHMWDFFRLQIPWRGVLFSEQAMLRLRRECFRPTDPARRLREIAGGLNQMRYSQFLEHLRAAGWQFDYLAVNAIELPLVRPLSDALARVPVLQDFIAHNVYCVLRAA